MRNLLPASARTNHWQAFHRSLWLMHISLHVLACACVLSVCCGATTCGFSIDIALSTRLILTSQDVRCQTRQINPAAGVRCVSGVSTVFNLNVSVAVAKTAGWCLSSSESQITATQEKKNNKKTWVHSVNNRNGWPVNTRLPPVTTCPVADNCIAKHRWCHYSVSITLCNPHLLHNDTLKQKACLLPL